MSRRDAMIFPLKSPRRRLHTTTALIIHAEIGLTIAAAFYCLISPAQLHFSYYFIGLSMLAQHL